jgi:hypothetical protein
MNIIIEEIKTTTASPELIEAAKTFFLLTKQQYPSCQFASLNIWGPRQDWEAWGDFEDNLDAQRVAIAWGFAFKHNATMEQRENKMYRVAVKM